MHHILYETINTVNGKTYVGIHSTEDLNDGYPGSGKLLKRAISKYGKENFVRTTIAECPNRGILVDLEAQWVDEEFVARKDTYNLVLGGGDPPTWYGKDHHAFGKPRSKEYRQKLSDANKGKQASLATKIKMSKTRLGLTPTIVVCPHCGKHGGNNVMKRWHFDNCKLSIGGN